MNITGLINKELESSIRDFGEDDSFVKMSRNIMKYFGYKVLEEIHRLNFPAFTLLYDNDLTKQGFVNMILNHLIDEDDELYGKKNFKYTEYESWKKIEIEKPCIHDKLLIVKRKNGKLDFAKFNKFEIWINQNGKKIFDVVEWRTFLPSCE